jgi:replicative DNA helicase
MDNKNIEDQNIQQNSNSINDISFLSNNFIEQMVLGTLLNNNDSFELVSDLLEPICFANQHHQIFFKEMRDKFYKGSIVNTITISSTLNKHNINYDYLLEVSKYTTNTDNIRDYAIIIRELYIKREAIVLGDYLKEKAKEDDFLEKGIYKVEEKLYNLSSRTSDSHFSISFGEGLIEVEKTIKNLLSSQKRINGLTTGFIDLDNLLGGLQNGYLYILAARPSMGKSALASNIAVNCALDTTYGGPVAFISLEMPYNQIVMRIMSGLSGVPLSQLINGFINKQTFSECMNTLKNFYNLPLYIYDTSALSIGEIKTILRQMKRKWGIKMAIIDYLQLVHGGGENENRVAEVSRITRLLKATAKELKIPIIALSQLSRSAETTKTKAHSNYNNREKNQDIPQADNIDNYKPQLWHLRESGSIEQDADVVMFIVREDYYKSKEGGDNLYSPPADGIGLAKLYVDKNRNGATGSIKLTYNSFITSFKNFIQ